MKKAIYTLLIAIVTLGASINVSAQKFAYVDSQAILQSLPERKAAEDSVKNVERNLSKELTELQSYLEEKYTEYTQAMESGTASDTKLKMMAQNVQDLDARIQQRQQAANKELEKLQQELMMPILEKTQAMIETVSKEGGYTYVFDVSTLVYADDSAENITDKVKEKLGIPVGEN